MTISRIIEMTTEDNNKNYDECDNNNDNDNDDNNDDKNGNSDKRFKNNEIPNDS